jgi:hypothetical protein
MRFKRRLDFISYKEVPMDFKSRIEGFTTNQIIHLIVELLSKVSDENLVSLTYLGEKLASDPETLAIRPSAFFGMSSLTCLLEIEGSFSKPCSTGAGSWAEESGNNLRPRADFGLLSS